MKKNVVIGLIGSVLDAGTGPSRWDRWRPSVALCQHENLLIDRFELIYQEKFLKQSMLVMEDIRSVSPETLVVPTRIEFSDPWDFEEVYGALHEFARNYPFDPESEEYLVNVTTGTHVVQICLFLLAESHRIPGQLIQVTPPRRQTGCKPGGYSIIDLDLSKYDALASRFRNEAKDDISFLKSDIETRNNEFNRLIEQIERVAINSQRPILLTGPTGAGKSRLARRIYELKRNRHQISGRFVEVNCATLRGDMAMATLFGHVRGAFSGAQYDRQGLLREADGGLLFLDEVAELGLDEQAMLLRALEDRTFFPLGSDTEVTSSFQLIAGTNKDLALEGERSKFREDLLARINLWTFRLPGLKDRTEDIEPNIRYELDQFEKTSGIRVAFNKEALSRFLHFSVSADALWKANFRDLNGAVTRMATLAQSGRITVENVDAEIERLICAWQSHGEKAKSCLHQILGSEQVDRIDPFDRQQLEHVVQVCRESRTLSEAGRKLFSVSRTQKRNANDADRLKKYLARFALDWKDL